MPVTMNMPKIERVHATDLVQGDVFVRSDGEVMMVESEPEQPPPPKHDPVPRICFAASHFTDDGWKMFEGRQRYRLDHRVTRIARGVPLSAMVPAEAP